MIWPKDKLQFAFACLWVVLAALHFIDRNSAHPGLFGGYDWMVWTLGSIVFFVSAYRSPGAGDDR